MGTKEKNMGTAKAVPMSIITGAKATVMDVIGSKLISITVDKQSVTLKFKDEEYNRLLKDISKRSTVVGQTRYQPEVVEMEFADKSNRKRCVVSGNKCYIESIALGFTGSYSHILRAIWAPEATDDPVANEVLFTLYVK